jgi:hypothetical protein
MNVWPLRICNGVQGAKHTLVLLGMDALKQVMVCSCCAQACADTIAALHHGIIPVHHHQVGCCLLGGGMHTGPAAALCSVGNCHNCHLANWAAGHHACCGEPSTSTRSSSRGACRFCQQSVPSTSFTHSISKVGLRIFVHTGGLYIGQLPEAACPVTAGICTWIVQHFICWSNVLPPTCNAYVSNGLCVTGRTWTSSLQCCLCARPMMQ